MASELPIRSLLDEALDDESAPPVEPELLPSRLAHAAADVLGVDGVSLSLMSMELRVPLGASSARATAAERLQFTLGEGPCLEALHGGLPTRSGDADLARSWPNFHRALVATTPFRSVAAVSLPFTPEGDGGALDLYLLDTRDVTQVDLDLCGRVADEIVDRLIRAVSPQALAGAEDASYVPWLHGEDARARMEVWVAIGMLTSDIGLVAADGLAMMRAWAFSHGVTLDDVAAQLVAGTVTPALLQP